MHSNFLIKPVSFYIRYRENDKTIINDFWNDVLPSVKLKDGGRLFFVTIMRCKLFVPFRHITIQGLNIYHYSNHRNGCNRNIGEYGISNKKSNSLFTYNINVIPVLNYIRLKNTHTPNCPFHVNSMQLNFQIPWLFIEFSLTIIYLRANQGIDCTFAQYTPWQVFFAKC